MKAQDEKESLKNKSEQARKGFRPTSASQNFLEFSGNFLGIVRELLGNPLGILSEFFGNFRLHIDTKL